MVENSVLRWLRDENRRNLETAVDCSYSYPIPPLSQSIATATDSDSESIFDDACSFVGSPTFPLPQSHVASQSGFYQGSPGVTLQQYLYVEQLLRNAGGGPTPWVSALA
jgi:hypothetical protein